MNYAERAVALSSALEADGYHMAIEEADAKLSVIITAGPDACEDCLVPEGPDALHAQQRARRSTPS